MAQCQAQTQDGRPCRNPALPGSPYCRVHQPKEEPVIVRTEKPMVALRYVGQGTYQVAGYLFTPQTPVQEVPERLAEFLLDTEPELFILADKED